jgi:uncharacterized protein
MTLLAVRQSSGNDTGSTADLLLEIKPGKGRVYLDTFPLTKVDTQISTRFAKEIACDYINANCDNFDFFYTITAGTSIIGGPSAGAAMASLTVALLKDMKYDDSIAVTGTINSGGLVGPVGGLREKIMAASQNRNIKKVLIPLGERLVKEGNTTVDMEEFGRGIGVLVAEVSTLNDAVFEFTGKQVKQKRGNLTIDTSYESTMKLLAENLCDRSKTLRGQVKWDFTEALSDDYNITRDFTESAKNLTDRASRAFDAGHYYASASYCFGANVKYQQILQMRTNPSEMTYAILNVSAEIGLAREKLNSRKLRTIKDLQTYMVVSQRISEASDQIKLAKSPNGSSAHVAYALERLRSADSWSAFFGQPGKEFNFDENVLRQSCLNKIAEAEESYQYVNVFFPGLLENSLTDINQAYELSRNKEYALCLAKASNAKADANTVLDVIGVDEQQMNTLIEQKLQVVKEVIIEQAEQNAFPVLGYSYWEYAATLKDYDKYSALLYSEYALELSNLDIYFKKDGQDVAPLEEQSIVPLMIWVFAFGLSVGLLLGFVVKSRKNRMPAAGTKRKSKRSG